MVPFKKRASSTGDAPGRVEGSFGGQRIAFNSRPLLLKNGFQCRG
jgi:hypothetical protein